MFPLNVCAFAGGVYIRISIGSSNSTTRIVNQSNFTSSDCSGTASGVGVLGTYSTGCSQVSSSPPSGFLSTATSGNAGCNSPFSEVGYVSGVCYPQEGGGFFQFQACGANNSYSTLVYQNSGCSGASYTVGNNSFSPSACIFLESANTSISGGQCISPQSPSAPPTSSSGSGSNNCFEGTELVTLPSGASLPMSEVKVGDRILSGNALGETSFSVVISVPHGANDLPATFLHLQLANGMDLKLTAEHLLMGGSCDDSALTLKTAASLHVGDCVRTVSGQEKISAIQEVQGKGVYTVVADEEFIVVNGVLASPFAVNHAVPNAFYHIHRSLFWMAPALVTSAIFAEAHRVFSALFVNASM